MKVRQGFIILDMQSMAKNTLLQRLPVYYRWIHKQELIDTNDIQWHLIAILPRMPGYALRTPSMVEQLLKQQDELKQVVNYASRYLFNLSLGDIREGHAGITHLWEQCNKPLILWERPLLRRYQHCWRRWWGSIKRLLLIHPHIALKANTEKSGSKVLWHHS